MTRDEMIDFLSDSDFQYIMQQDGGVELLDSYIRFGFKGYEAYTDAELRAETQQRKEIGLMA